MSKTDIDGKWCRALAEEIGDRPDLIERIITNYNRQADPQREPLCYFLGFPVHDPAVYDEIGEIMKLSGPGLVDAIARMHMRLADQSHAKEPK